MKLQELKHLLEQNGTVRVRIATRGNQDITKYISEEENKGNLSTRLSSDGFYVQVTTIDEPITEEDFMDLDCKYCEGMDPGCKYCVEPDEDNEGAEVQIVGNEDE